VRTGAVILAAGMSSRMGEAKQLLHWLFQVEWRIGRTLREFLTGCPRTYLSLGLSRMRAKCYNCNRSRSYSAANRYPMARTAT
jgi:CTP:molybdopterin cytidylyltransferase MocA